MDVRGSDLIDYLMNEKPTTEANSYTEILRLHLQVEISEHLEIIGYFCEDTYFFELPFYTEILCELYGFYMNTNFKFLSI